MKKDLKLAMQQNLDRELRSGSTRPRRLDAVVGGAAFAPRDITQPLDDLARKIKLDHIDPDPNQPRKTIDTDRLKELALSFKENGVLQPITVSRAGDTDRYRVIAGHRRVEAARLAKLSEIPAIIRPDTYDERRRLQEQLVENLQRENLPPIDEARGIATFIESTGLSQRQAAQNLGKPQTYVAELLQILRLPDKLLTSAAALPKHALIQASRIKDPKEQTRLIETALESDAPFQEIRKTRESKRPAAPEQFKETYRVEGLDGDLTVRLPKAPKRVTVEEVIDFIGKVARNLKTRKEPRE